MGVRIDMPKADPRDSDVDREFLGFPRRVFFSKEEAIGRPKDGVRRYRWRWLCEVFTVRWRYVDCSGTICFADDKLERRWRREMRKRRKAFEKVKP